MLSRSGNSSSSGAAGAFSCVYTNCAAAALASDTAHITTSIDASTTPIWQECYAWVQARLPEFAHVTQVDLDELDPRVTRSCTLSTLHGCPADEIERIADYLLREKGFNTFVKCNPTMLG